MPKLIIIGTGSLARLAHFYFSRDSDYDVTAFAIHRAMRSDDCFLSYPLIDLESLSTYYPPEACEVFVAIGYREMNRARARVFYVLKEKGYRLARYVSSYCTYLSDEPPGENSLIMENNTIQPFVQIGNNVILWSGNHIGHDTTVGDHCFIASHVVIAGYTRVNPYCFIGGNAVVSGGKPITLGESSLIRAGSVIRKNTPSFSVYTPAHAHRLRVTSDQTNL